MKYNFVSFISYRHTYVAWNVLDIFVGNGIDFSFDNTIDNTISPPRLFTVTAILIN